MFQSYDRGCDPHLEAELGERAVSGMPWATAPCRLSCTLCLMRRKLRCDDTVQALIAWQDDVHEWRTNPVWLTINAECVSFRCCYQLDSLTKIATYAGGRRRSNGRVYALIRVNVSSSTKQPRKCDPAASDMCEHRVRASIASAQAGRRAERVDDAA